MQTKIGVGVSMPRKMISKIDAERGDISRSRFLLRLLEKVYTNTSSTIQIENNKVQNKIAKPLQTGIRVGRSVNQSATDSMETTLEGDSIHG
jgi:hypothetical protein